MYDSHLNFAFLFTEKKTYHMQKEEEHEVWGGVACQWLTFTIRIKEDGEILEFLKS